MLSDTPEKCRHCGDQAGENYAGLCDSCFRKGTVVLSRKSDGTYQCGLCRLADRETHLDVDDRAAHLREVHSIDSDNRLQRVREYERLSAGTTHRQASLAEQFG